MKHFMADATETAWLAFLLSPDASKVVAHYLDEYRKAVAEGNDRPEWGELYACCSRILDTADGVSPDSNAWNFFLLGNLAERLCHPSFDAKQDVLYAALKQWHGENNIRDRNLFKKVVKVIAQELALKKWAEDSSIRTGCMVRIVKNLLFDPSVPEDTRRTVRHYLPTDKPLRSWLTEVAPESAKVPGAPRTPTK
jgi:hypothetical protein